MVLPFASALLAIGLFASGVGPSLPALQSGAEPPSAQSAPDAPPRRVGEINDEANRLIIENLEDQLRRIGAHFAPGMERVPGTTDQVAVLEPATDHRWISDLSGGSNYGFIGACDGDCTNVDIEIIDMTTGGVVASDMLPDDYPVVAFSPSEDGQYMVRVLLQACTVAPCYVASRVLVERAPK